MIAEFPLFIFTTLAGIAAGGYLARAAFGPCAAGSEGKRPWLFPLLCLVLLGLGLLGVLGHLQRPERFLNALANPQAGISQEAYWSIALSLVMAVDVILCMVKGTSPRWLRVIGAVFGFVLACIMGYAYFISYGVPAWNTLAVIPFYFAGDVALGLALWAVFDKGCYERAPFAISSAVMQGIFAISLAGMAVRFADLGLSPLPLAIALALGPVAGMALSLAALKGKGKNASVVIFALLLLALLIARYAFYAAYGA